MPKRESKNLLPTEEASRLGLCPELEESIEDKYRAMSGEYLSPKNRATLEKMAARRSARKGLPKEEKETRISDSGGTFAPPRRWRCCWRGGGGIRPKRTRHKKTKRTRRKKTKKRKRTKKKRRTRR